MLLMAREYTTPAGIVTKALQQEEHHHDELKDVRSEVRYGADPCALCFVVHDAVQNAVDEHERYSEHDHDGVSRAKVADGEQRRRNEQHRRHRPYVTQLSLEECPPGDLLAQREYQELKTR